MSCHLSRRSQDLGIQDQVAAVRGISFQLNAPSENIENEEFTLSIHNNNNNNNNNNKNKPRSKRSRPSEQLELLHDDHTTGASHASHLGCPSAYGSRVSYVKKRQV